MVPGVPVHAIQRGNNRAPCFVEDTDREFFLHHLGRLAAEEECALHAYCLMTNHVHLLLTPEREEGCARLFKRLGLLHTQYMNRKHRRSGTLWEGRFRSCLVQSEQYLLACYRYIELNPVRAGIVVSPADYAWSSYRANADGIPDCRITPHGEFERLGREQYRALFGSHLDPGLIHEIRSTTNGGYALGSTAFRARMAGLLGRPVSKGRPGRPQRDESSRSAGQKLI
jgi:putative transposase